MSSTDLYTRIRLFWTQQIRLHQMYLNRHDVSGMDALQALARRGTPRRTR